MVNGKDEIVVILLRLFRYISQVLVIRVQIVLHVVLVFPIDGVGEITGIVVVIVGIRWRDK